MSNYEIHISSGDTVKVISGDSLEMKVMKNGKVLYGNNSPPVESQTNNKKDSEPAEVSTEESEPVATPEENSNDSSETMAGGKKSRRNNARKANATRRKNQAGGKRGANGYMKFASKMRPQILKEHPELKSDVVAVARKIGEKWRALSASEKAKY